MTRPLRVLHLRNSDRLGGPERLILDQAALASADVQPVLASFGRVDRPHPFLDAARAAGLDARLVPQRGSWDPRLAARTRRLVEASEADVLVGHDYKANLLGRLAAGGRPRVAVVHGYTAEGRKVAFYERVDRRLLPGVRRVVCVSEALREVVLAAGVDPARIEVVTNGIRADLVAAAASASRAALREAWAVPDDVLLVLALGRLSPEKGQDVLLDAFARLPARPGALLVLAGDGASRAALADRAAAPDLAGRVRLVGWRDDPWACLGAADVLVLPSRREGLPVALLEAMAVGLPIVATRVGGVPTALDDGAAGRLVAPDDADALAGALGEVLADPAVRRRLGAAARERVAAAYDARRTAARLEAIYRAAADEA